MNRLFRNYPDVVTVKQLCKILQIGRNTAYELLKSKQIKSVRIGNKYIIPIKWVEEYFKDKCR